MGSTPDPEVKDEVHTALDFLLTGDQSCREAV